MSPNPPGADLDEHSSRTSWPAVAAYLKFAGVCAFVFAFL